VKFYIGVLWDTTVHRIKMIWKQVVLLNLEIYTQDWNIAKMINKKDKVSNENNELSKDSIPRSMKATKKNKLGIRIKPGVRGRSP
jgi:hypothetical protein